jgi:hypothetical protein
METHDNPTTPSPPALENRQIIKSHTSNGLGARSKTRRPQQRSLRTVISPLQGLSDLDSAASALTDGPSKPQKPPLVHAGNALVPWRRSAPRLRLEAPLLVAHSELRQRADSPMETQTLGLWALIVVSQLQHPCCEAGSFDHVCFFVPRAAVTSILPTDCAAWTVSKCDTAQKVRMAANESASAGSRNGEVAARRYWPWTLHRSLPASQPAEYLASGYDRH